VGDLGLDEVREVVAEAEGGVFVHFVDLPIVAYQ
jgi:hypothetical protein